VVLARVPTAAAAAKGSVAPTTVPVRAPTTAAAAKGPTTLTTGPTGALTPAAEKGRPARGWGCATTMVSTGVPATMTTPATRSQEATATWIVVMASAKSAEAMAEAMAMVSRLGAGGVTMSMQIGLKQGI
jgi:hypothetical protein